LQFLGQNRLHRNQGVCLYLSRSSSANLPKVEQVFQFSWTEFAYFQVTG
jgi:hypothetical protein